MTLGRALELAYLAAHAQWCLDAQHAAAAYAVAATRRFARHGVDLIDDGVDDDRAALLG
jgi:acyl-CoA dehydrogenase